MSAASGWPPLQRSLVAILRGIRPHEAADIVGALVEAGFEAIEIPLNSPDPFASIEIAVNTAPDGALIGAGTVLVPEEVDRLSEIGGRLVVSPNADPAVIKRTSDLGLVSMPGVFTATEAFSALRAGASGLKFFPASVLGAAGVAAISAVLPPGTETAAVGGVSHNDFASYAQAGVRTFGLGTSLYKPGLTAAEVETRAVEAIKAYDTVFGRQN
ncbi:2-dehydro-3-deoxy-6-phosphogalactonate aldolase [Hoeflea sp. CAU 1731]